MGNAGIKAPRKPWNMGKTALQRERPVNPERSRRSMAAALESVQRSFESAGDRPKADYQS